jgi:hypothetical protein
MKDKLLDSDCDKVEDIIDDDWGLKLEFVYNKWLLHSTSRVPPPTCRSFQLLFRFGLRLGLTRNPREVYNIKTYDEHKVLLPNIGFKDVSTNFMCSTMFLCHALP